MPFIPLRVLWLHLHVMSCFALIRCWLWHFNKNSYTVITSFTSILTHYYLLHLWKLTCSFNTALLILPGQFNKLQASYVKEGNILNVWLLFQHNLIFGHFNNEKKWMNKQWCNFSLDELVVYYLVCRGQWFDPKSSSWVAGAL